MKDQINKECRTVHSPALLVRLNHPDQYDVLFEANVGQFGAHTGHGSQTS